MHLSIGSSKHNSFGPAPYIFNIAVSYNDPIPSNNDLKPVHVHHPDLSQAANASFNLYCALMVVTEQKSIKIKRKYVESDMTKDFVF